MTLIYNKRLADNVPHRILGYHGPYYITDMTDYIIRTEKDDENTQTIGLEIEVTRMGKPITDAMIEKIFSLFPYGQLSSDCSIPGSHNFEMQTQPMTPNAIKESGLKELLKYLQDHDFKASAVTSTDDGTGCGGHIHISKGDKWEDIVALMAIFIDQNKHIVQDICLRPFTHYAYNNLQYLDKSIKRFTIQGVKEYMLSHTSDHSAMLNLQHSATIEFRLPIGTINFETKMAHIEFITNLYKCCEDVINKRARIDRLTINKVCQNGEYLPNFMKKLGVYCSKTLKLLDNDIKKRLRDLDEDKTRLINILSALQRELATTRDIDIRQGSINTISNRFNEIANANNTSNLMCYIRNMKTADNISDGLATYTTNHDNNITKYYNQLVELVHNINTDDIYYNIEEEI